MLRMAARLGVGFIGSGFIIRFHIRSWEAVRDADVALEVAEFQPGLCIDCARSRLPEHVAPAAHDSDGE